MVHNYCIIDQYSIKIYYNSYVEKLNTDKKNKRMATCI